MEGGTWEEGGRGNMGGGREGDVVVGVDRDDNLSSHYPNSLDANKDCFQKVVCTVT